MYVHNYSITFYTKSNPFQLQTVLIYRDKEGNKDVQTKGKRHDDGTSSTAESALSNQVKKRNGTTRRSKWSSNEGHKVITNKRGIVGRLLADKVFVYCSIHCA